MLRVTRDDIAQCGGFLSAISQVSAEYLHQLLAGAIVWQENDPPDRLIVHKAPHLDDYFAEMLFRSALDSDQRRREFLEQALYAEDDLTARVQWPTAAVFGIGAALPCGDSAQHLFDEHIGAGGRTTDSCATLVANRCFQRLPASVARVIGEIGDIDSSGGAHELHLNNLLKTCHSVQYWLGNADGGRRMSGKLNDHWKRAIVNALIAAVVYCLEAGIDITEADRVKGEVSDEFVRFASDCPYKDFPDCDKSIQRVRGAATSTKQMLDRSLVSIGGRDEPQLLIAPFMAFAAREAWGTEIAYFLMVHFWESEVLKNIHFIRVESLLETCFEDPKKLIVSSRSHYTRPKVVYGDDCSMGGAVLTDCRFTGRLRTKSGVDLPAKFPSDLWILSCRHNNFTLTPNKAMARFLSERNCGIGLILCENTKDMTKVLFKERHLPDTFWNELVKRINRKEPGLWYRPQPTTPFILNGNAAHQYLDLSSLTLARLIKISREVH
jgi:hypothetical protein